MTMRCAARFEETRGSHWFLAVKCEFPLGWVTLLRAAPLLGVNPLVPGNTTIGADSDIGGVLRRQVTAC